ncbi:class I SAM-dependent methyltransferase [Accumulibacter sp.]|uniref:class I SAM-dependent methyltransferase n=1 Tax=Accumulibacter sp. TaxID=2053492 RepID=UPI001A4CFFC8|nr:class I SAM-dependent methyltransferase [Accumulibacter sp.]MBL8375939.1 class I SAM-dependent methyltransferase [Accumulibacter sp.]
MLSPAFADVRPASAMGVDIALESRESEAVPIHENGWTDPTGRAERVADRDEAAGHFPLTTLGYHCWRELDYLPATRDLLPVALAEHVRAGQRALDVGCHHGAAAVYLASLGLRVLGVDINPRAIEAARQHRPDAASRYRPEFIVADFLRDRVAAAGSIDVVVLNRFLTCLPAVDDWQDALSRALELLTEGGLIYVGDFLLMPACPHNRRRYQLAHANGGRWGNFAVLDDQGRPSFVAHHHSVQELRRMVSPYRVLCFRRFSTRSRHGHASRMFELIGVNERRPV